MTTENPYQAPQATLGGSADDANRPLAPGDLERALAGTHKLDAGAVLKEAWRLTAGAKLMVHVAFSIIGLAYAVGLVLVMGVFLSDISLELLADGPAFAQRMQSLATDWRYHLVALVVMLPLNGLMYASSWNLGLRRAAGHPLRLADAFPLRVWLRATGVLVPAAVLGLGVLVHPMLSWLGTPVTFLVLLAIPAVIDRDMGVVAAIRTSATLTAKNLVAMMLIVMALMAGYIGATLTCGIGLIWYLPWAVMVLGATWRQLAGFETIPRLA